MELKELQGISQSDLHMDPGTFRALLSLVSGAAPPRKDRYKQIEDHVRQAEGALDEITNRCDVLARSNNHMMNAWRMTARRADSPKPGESPEAWEDEFKHSASGSNFLRVSFEVCLLIKTATQRYVSIIRGLREPSVLMPAEFGEVKTIGDVQAHHYAMQVNGPPLKSYADSAMDLSAFQNYALATARMISEILSSYYRELMKRHSVDGVRIFGSAVLTDVAMHIFENVDSDGEVAAGKSADSLSAYSARKARIMAEAIRDPFVESLLLDDGFISFVAESMERICEAAESLRKIMADDIARIRGISGRRSAGADGEVSRDFHNCLVEIRDVNPSSVAYREKSALMSQMERAELEYKNRTLENIVDMYRAGSSPEEIVLYVLQRKEETTARHREENSFYVCNISAGNPFLGEAPGAMKVVPGNRPGSSLDDIVGSGFSELKEFYKTIKGAARWGDLFMATSPSRSADKSNILLIGPQGCGKTEAMRSVAAERDSISIFAVGSDFLTCWRGEAVKNPKRLFEAAVKIQKESGRHVHILLDEVDAVMKKRELVAHGDDDLTTEFQNLMDGIVHYPNVTVWAATNHPERIPMPLIRRFSKVLIVGELDSENRKTLLRKFLSYLPTEDYAESEWDSWSRQLDGATGDVVRKVVDHVWRTRMQWFVDSKPEAAKRALDWLGRRGRFLISEFSEGERSEFKAILAAEFTVTARDVGASVESHLRNVAIRTEINAARETYAQARRVVSEMSGLVVL